MRIGESSHNNYSTFHRQVPPVSQREPAGQVTSPQDTLPPAAASAQDIVTISADERQRLKKESLQKQLEEARQELDSFQRLLDNSHQQAKAAGEAARIRVKCMIIASRIMAGDKVPREDYHYLAKHEPELYGKALTMRFERDKPKKYNRLSEEEEDIDYSGSALEEEGPLLSSEAGNTNLPEDASQSS